MAKKFGGEPNERMSNIMSGTRHRGAGEIRAGSTVRSESYANSPVLGTSGPFKTQTSTAAPGKTNLQKTKNVPRTYASKGMSKLLFSIFARGPIKKPVVAAKPVAKKPVAKPAAVVSNVTNEKLSPAKAAPRGMAINPRTGNTTGFTTGTTTGSSASKPGVAGRTYQSAGDRMKATTERRFGVAGPMGGGSSRSSSTSSSSSSRSSGSSSRSFSGTRTNEPAGPKRG